jgi:hypothetical protein
VWVLPTFAFQKQTDMNIGNTDGTIEVLDASQLFTRDTYALGASVVGTQTYANQGWWLCVLLYTQMIWLQLYGENKNFAPSPQVLAQGDGSVPATQVAINYANGGGVAA